MNITPEQFQSGLQIAGQVVLLASLLASTLGLSKSKSKVISVLGKLIDVFALNFGHKKG